MINTLKKTGYIIFTINILLWSIFILPQTALAADASEAFTGYSAGALNGNSGGSGWSGNWATGSTGTGGAVVTTGGQSGEYAEEGNSATNEESNKRTFTTGITNGTMTWYGNQIGSDGNGNANVIFEKSDGTDMFNIFFQRDGLGAGLQLQGATNATLGTWTLGTWHLLSIEFGDTGGSGTCNANEVRAKLDAGSWGSCLAYKNSQTGTVEQIDVHMDSALANRTFGFDTFTLTDNGGGVTEFDMSPYNVNLWNELF